MNSKGHICTTCEFLFGVRLLNTYFLVRRIKQIVKSACIDVLGTTIFHTFTTWTQIPSDRQEDKEPLGLKTFQESRESLEASTELTKYLRPPSFLNSKCKNMFEEQVTCSFQIIFQTNELIENTGYSGYLIQSQFCLLLGPKFRLELEKILEFKLSNKR